MLVLVVAGAWYVRFLQRTKNHPLLLKDSAIHEWYKRNIRRRRLGIGGTTQNEDNDKHIYDDGNEHDNYYTSCPMEEEGEFRRRRRRKLKEEDDQEEGNNESDDADAGTSSDDDDDDDENDHQGYYHPYNTPEVQNALTFPIPLPQWFETATRTAVQKIDEQVDVWKQELKETFEMPKQIFKPIQVSTFFKNKRQRATKNKDDKNDPSESEATSDPKNNPHSSFGNELKGETNKAFESQTTRTAIRNFFGAQRRKGDVSTATVSETKTITVTEQISSSPSSTTTRNVESSSTSVVSGKTNIVGNSTIGIEQRWKRWRHATQLRQEELQNNVKLHVAQIRQHFFPPVSSNLHNDSEGSSSSDNFDDKNSEHKFDSELDESKNTLVEAASHFDDRSSDRVSLLETY